MTHLEMGQAAGALSRAATLVDDARTDFDGLAARLTAQIDAQRGQWVGAGAEAFFALQDAWDVQQRRIVAALDGFGARLRATEADTVSTDDQVSAAFRHYLARLG